jgi:glycosyltransferase involved in cell wall biosynthesis
LGPGTTDDVIDAYAAASVVVVPSYWEALGTVILEAQAMAKPVVAYDTGGISEAMQKGITGYLAPTGNKRELHSHIRFLLKNPQLAYDMGGRGRLFVILHYRLSSMAEKYKDLYRRVISIPDSLHYELALHRRHA